MTPIREQARTIKKEAKKQILGYLVGAFGLVAALAWNDAIKAFIEYIFPIEKNGLSAKFIYAVIITLVVVVVSLCVFRFLKGEEED